MPVHTSQFYTPCLDSPSQVKVKKGDTDLTIDQLHEVFVQLGKDKVSVSKFEKRLEEVARKWDDIKKAQPQIKTDVEPIQVSNRLGALC